MDNTTPIWRSQLQLALAAARLNEGQQDAILSKFDVLEKRTNNPALAFRTIHSAYAEHSGKNDDTEGAVNSIRAAIEKANREVRIETNPLQRLRELIRRHNTNVCKMEVLLDGVSALSEPERERVKMKLPGFLKEETFLATASTKGGKKCELGLEVRF